jgi:hypothetical protein
MVCIDQIYTAYTRCFDPDVPARTTCFVDVGGLGDNPWILSLLVNVISRIFSLQSIDKEQASLDTYFFLFQILFKYFGCSMHLDLPIPPPQ